MSGTWIQVLVGFAFSLGLGYVVVSLFLKCLRQYMKVEPKPGSDLRTKGVPSGLMGLVERLFFTIVIAFDISGASVAMIAWLGAKLASNWNLRAREAHDEEDRLIAVQFSVSAAVAGLLSMMFALLGGLICRGDIWWTPP